MKSRIFGTAGVILLLLFFNPGIKGESLNLTGYVRNYTGMLLEGGNDFSILQNTFNLNLEHSKGKIAFKVNPYIYDYQNKDLEIGLRQAYIDIFFNSMDIRIGKQQIIWGKADGVFITDVISPKDLREFLLPEFDEIRMGITAVKVDYYIGNSTLELVWVPVFSPTMMPEADSIWNPGFDLPLQPEFDYSRQEVQESLKNSEVFLKYSTVSSAIDLEFMAGYMWDDDPAMHTVKNIDPVTMQPDSITIIPQHHRLGLAGGSFSTTLGGYVIRGEGAYYFGKYFLSEDPMVEEAVVEKDYIQYLIGVDFTLMDIKMSVQFIQQYILDYDDPIVNDRAENIMTFLATKDFLIETLFLELFSYIGLNDGDALIRGKVKYKLTDELEILLGANIFTGTEGMFGQYNKNDMVYAKVKYSF